MRDNNERLRQADRTTCGQVIGDRSHVGGGSHDAGANEYEPKLSDDASLAETSSAGEGVTDTQTARHITTEGCAELIEQAAVR